MPVKPPLTHFLAIPLYNSRSATALTSALSHFSRETGQPRLSSSDPTSTHGSEQYAKEASRTILPSGSVRPSTTLHLTLGVMSLTKPERLEAAVGLLVGLDMREHFPASADKSKSAEPTDGQDEAAVPGPMEASSSWSNPVPEPNTIHVQLKGLHSMQDARATSVLYAAPEDRTDRLFSLCDSLREKFALWGYIVDEDRPLKLHATIVNTIYAKQQGRRERGKGKVKIDARDLVDQWRDHVWADITIDKVVIYEMGAKEDEHGEVTYKQVAEKALQ